MHIYNELMSLNKESTLDDIIKVLLYDYKKERPQIKSEENKKYEYVDSFEKYKNIKNYFRYKILNKLDASFDCDCCSSTMYILGKLLETKGFIVSKKDGRTFTCQKDENEFMLDTDTFNSIYHILGFIYGNRFSITEKLEELEIEKDIELFEKVDQFCLLSYTIGNFVFIPKYYNRNRNTNVGDYSDLTIDDLKKDYNEIEQTQDIVNENSFNMYKKYIKDLYMDRYIDGDYKSFESIIPRRFINCLSSYDKETYNSYLKDRNNLFKYIDEVNKTIILRGIDILCALNKDLINNKNLRKIEENIDKYKELLF